MTQKQHPSNTKKKKEKKALKKKKYFRLSRLQNYLQNL